MRSDANIAAHLSIGPNACQWSTKPH